MTLSSHTNAIYFRHRKGQKKGSRQQSFQVICKPFQRPICRFLSQFLKCIFTMRCPHHTKSCFWKCMTLRFGVMRLSFFLFYWWCEMLCYSWRLNSCKTFYSTIKQTFHDVTLSTNDFYYKIISHKTIAVFLWILYIW